MMVRESDGGRGGRPLVILAAEDDPHDLWLLTQALQSAAVPVSFHSTRDGREVLGYLQGEGDFGDRERHPVPDLLVLDLKMPGMSGLEVLSWVRGSPEYARLPAIVLSGSMVADDVEQAYHLGVNGFFSKPNGLQELKDLVQAITFYWGQSLRPAGGMVVSSRSESGRAGDR